MGMPGGQELIIILLIIVLLFGAKKIPELAKGFGKGIKNFKAEMKDVSEDTTTTTATAEEAKKVEPTQESASAEAPKTTTQA